MNITNSKLSNEDVLVFIDLISEANQFCIILIHNHELTEKLISSFFFCFQELFITENVNEKDTKKLISIPYIMKLFTLDTKYQFLFQNYIEIRKTVEKDT